MANLRTSWLLVIAFAGAAAWVGCDDDTRNNPGRDAAAGSSGRGGSGGVTQSPGGRGGGIDARGDAPADAGAIDAPADAGAITVNRPERRDFSDALAAQLRVPAGFSVTVFARELGSPRMLAVAADGALYVTVPAMGRVLRLADGNGDGDASDAGEAGVVADRMTMPDLDGVHGIAIHDGRIYLATVKSVFSGALGAGGAITGLSKIVADLPDGGQHPNRTLGVGPDGKLYVSIGSTCNACPETNTEHASLLRIELTGAAASNPANPQHPMMARNPAVMMSPRVFASGLRNTIGFDWHPSTMALWGSDHGSDGLGDDIPPDEINLIEGGKSYGWPYCWGDRQLDPTMGPPSAMVSQQAYCTSTAAPMAVYGAHSAPIAFVFYRGTQFPTEFAGDAFVALHGSWNRSMPTGYKVVRVHFAAGAPAALPSGSVMQDFLTGFLIENGGAHFGRPAGLAVDATGALVISDDSNGVIYRVRHTSAADAGTD